MGVRRPGAAAMASPLRERPLETLRAPLVLGLLLLAAYLATRIAFAARFPYFLDEGTYAVFSWEGSRSLGGLYSSYSIGREPLMFWLGIPWVKLGFNPLDAVRIVSIGCGIVTAAFTGLTARELGGTVAGWAGTGLCVVMPFLVVHDGIGIIEPLVTAVVAAALYLQIRLARAPDLRVAVALGVVLAAGMLTKENTRITLLLLPLSLICFDWAAADRGERLRRWLTGIGVCGLFLIAAQVVLRASSRYGEYQDARESPLLYTVRPLREVLSDPFEFGATWAAYHPAFTGYITIPLLAVAGAGALLAIARRSPAGVLVLAWVLVPFAISMLFSTAPFPRHVMYLVPPAIVLMAYALGEAWGALSARLPGPRGVALAAALLALLLVPALRFDVRVLDDPATTRYPGLDDVQYVTGTGGGTVWPPIAREIERRARGPQVVVISPRAYTQVLEMVLGPDPRYRFVPGSSPLARQAQFVVDDEIPFLDGDAATIMRELDFRPVAHFARPRGGKVARLLVRGG
jgi:4-amino-4-deoxy-L-arabinose transferase-like glycosyltransferase